MGFVAIALLLHWYFLGIRFQRRIRFQREIRFQRGIFWLLIVLTQIYVDVLLIRYFMVLFNQELIRIQIILAKEFINFLYFIVFKMKSFRLVMMSASFYGFFLKFFTYTLWNLLHVNIWKIFVWLFASWSTSGMLWASATFIPSTLFHHCLTQSPKLKVMELALYQWNDYIDSQSYYFLTDLTGSIQGTFLSDLKNNY